MIWYGTILHTKWKLKPSGHEGIRHKFAYESLQGMMGYGTNLHTKWKLKPSGHEGIRHKFAYEMEAEAFRA